MEKLLELEKKLKEHRESLEKMSSPINESGEEIDKSEKHKDEKEDKKMIAEALDVHNEKKHGEAKDKNSAFKDAGLKKSIDERLDDILEKGLGSKLDNTESKERVKQALGSIRQPAKVTTAQGTKEVSPKEQVSDKVAAVSQKKDAAKMKAESEAAARRDQYRKEGFLKSEEIAPEGSKNRESYKEEFGKKEKKHKDEKEDKRMIAEALDVHNEKKHGEAKDKNSAFKDAGIKKSDKMFFKNNSQWNLE